MRKTLFARIFPSFLLLIAASSITIALLSFLTLRVAFYDIGSQGLSETARVLSTALAPALEDLHSHPESLKSLESLCASLVEGSGIRLTIIDEVGRVIADTEVDPILLENHADRPEIIKALENGSGVSRRWSTSTKVMRIYSAIRVSVPPAEGAKTGPGAIFLVRASLDLPEAEKAIRAFYLRLFLGSLLVLILAFLIGLYLSRRLSAPVVELRKAAEKFAAGELSYKAHADGSSEMATLAAALNSMAAELSEKIGELDLARTETEAVLDGLGEAVIVVDGKLTVKSLNRAAAEIFGLRRREGARTGHGFEGSDLLVATRSTELLRLAESVLASGEGLEETATAYLGSALRMRAKASPLDEANGERSVILVLEDITTLERLERVRSDFVANVSHELKTPITSIKGFVEALLDGGFEDGETAKKFLGIIGRQTERLDGIIDDLLSLARIEVEGKKGIERTEVAVKPLLEEAARSLEAKADAKRIGIALKCGKELSFSLNSGLIIQALVNLVDNAVKYSPDGTEVELSAATEDGELRLRVRDEGQGIPLKDQPRLFERFYRVDKARSRDSGGTGLGLAIVKHIALAHGGEASVESWEGSGSTFTMRIPGYKS